MTGTPAPGRPGPGLLTVSAIVLAYGAEPWLERCVYALLASRDVQVEVVLVDNGCTDGAVDRLRDVPGVVPVGAGENLGFSAGNNVGVSASNGDYVALVNGDAIAEPDALARLVGVAADPAVGAAGASVRLADDPSRLNSNGNVVHFLGFSWCGGFGEPAATAAGSREVASLMGAAFLMRRAVWDELDGFDPHYFAFHEDAELCWRARQRGYSIRHVADAVVVHRYEFSKRPDKLYLSERNRLIFLLTCWGTGTLVLLAPVLLPVEAAVLAFAARQGWLRQKLDGWRWLWRNRAWLAIRRERVQRERTVSDARLAPFFESRLGRSGVFEIPEQLEALDRILAAYWAFVRRVLR